MPLWSLMPAKASRVEMVQCFSRRNSSKPSHRAHTEIPSTSASGVDATHILQCAQPLRCSAPLYRVAPVNENTLLCDGVESVAGFRSQGLSRQGPGRASPAAPASDPAPRGSRAATARPPAHRFLASANRSASVTPRAVFAPPGPRTAAAPGPSPGRPRGRALRYAAGGRGAAVALAPLQPGADSEGTRRRRATRQAASREGVGFPCDRQSTPSVSTLPSRSRSDAIVFGSRIADGRVP